MCLLLLSACGGRNDSGAGSDFTAGAAGASTLSLGGTVSGLVANNPLVLVNNADASTALTVPGNGAFTFAQRYANGAAYNVTVRTQPATQNCTVVNGSGTLPFTTGPRVTCLGLGKLPSGTLFATVAAAALPASVTVSTVAGDASDTTHVFKGGLPSGSILSSPHFLATDGTHLYLTEGEANAIRKISLSDYSTSNFLDGGVSGFADDAAGSGGAKFNDLEGIVTDGKYLYVGDMYNCAIRKIEISTKKVTTIAGQGGICRSGTTWADGKGTDITLGASPPPTDNTNTLFNLRALALSDDGKTLYFGDLNLLRKLDLATGMVTTILGRLGENGVIGNADGSFATAFIKRIILSIAVNGNNLYMLTGTLDHTLRKVDLAAQTVSTLELFYAEDDGSHDQFDTDNKALLDSIQASNPNFKPFRVRYGLSLSTSLVTDGTYIYISALAANQVARIRADGTDNGIPTPLVNPSQAYDYTDGLGGQAHLKYPLGITSDGKYLYLVDKWSYTVRKIAPN
ncbi:hypothetical protein [Rhodoferax lacus]|uniref:hypothetical protein n=1 Tax=Rhodoferax lacus TaxID=2184758 RepID=UPI0011C1461D|nr:hypothetical protein [Rhodoferax lacus]